MAINKVIYAGSTLIDLTSDTVTSADHIMSGYIGHLADGSQVTGTGSGGGSSSWTKVAETTYTVSTTSTSAGTVATWSTGDSSIWDATKIIYIKVRDTAGKRAGYFYGTDNFYMNYGIANGSSSTSTYNGSIRIMWTYSSSSEFGWRYGYSSTGYGVYPDYIYSDGRIRIRRRYNSSYSLTINGTYKVEVYVLATPDGTSPFA